MPERDLRTPGRDFWKENALTYCNRLQSNYAGRTGTKIVLSNAQKNFLAEISMEDLYTVALALIETEFAHYITSMSSYVGKDLTIIPVTKLVGRRNSQTHKKYYSFLDWFTSYLLIKQS